ncbi:unnamed protein product [Urochloa humidicola]
MLNNGIFSDIVMNADGGSIKAHRAVLGARSPVFMRMFLTDFKEKEQSVVDITDMSHEACRAFISYSTSMAASPRRSSWPIGMSSSPPVTSTTLLNLRIRVREA